MLDERLIYYGEGRVSRVSLARGASVTDRWACAGRDDGVDLSLALGLGLGLGLGFKCQNAHNGRCFGLGLGLGFRYRCFGHATSGLLVSTSDIGLGLGFRISD